MTATNSYIIDILQQNGLVSLEAGQAALARAHAENTSLIDQLTAAGLERERIYRTLAAAGDMEFVSLASIHPENAALLPAEVALRYRVLPVRQTGNTLVLAVGDPLDLEAIDTLRYLLQPSVEPVAALPEEIEQALAQLYPNSAPATSEATAAESDEPVIRLVNQIIEEAFRLRASDIHLEPLRRLFRVRYRIDGVLRETDNPARSLHPAVISRIKIMAGMKISEKRLPQDGRIQLCLAKQDLDLRISSIPSSHGESIVMRILNKETLAPGLPHLGLYPDDRRIFESMIRSPDGMILVTGPTGSGKTTTLYACLHELNRPDRKIITVEDPVEYQLSGINQVHVRPNIGLTFSAALRSIMRQAPNIIMIGEIRDRETAEIAVNAALTGHVVLSTLHTNDAPGAITRLSDIGIKPFLTSSSLRGILAQRLVRTICDQCRSAYSPTPRELQLLGNETNELYRGNGCAACGQSGYQGRKGIFELLPVGEEMQQMIYAGLPAAELRAHARELGLHTLREDGMRKAADGVTTLNEVLRVTMKDDGP